MRYRSISTIIRTETGWATQQHRAFCGWANFRLTGDASAEAVLTDLEKDFKDGLLLHRLLCKVSGKLCF